MVETQMVETVHRTMSICDLCAKPRFLPFGRLIPMKKHDVGNLTYHCLSMLCSKCSKLCSKCSNNLLLVGSLLLQWQGKVLINSSFCERESVNVGMTEAVVGESNDDNHNDDDDSEVLDENDDKDDAAQNSDKDVKPFDAAATTRNGFLSSSRGVHAQRISADLDSHDKSNNRTEAKEDEDNDEDYESSPRITLPQIRGKHQPKHASCLCPTCGKERSSKDTLRKHQQHHCPWFLQCPKCPLSFRLKYQLKNHMLVH